MRKAICQADGLELVHSGKERESLMSCAAIVGSISQLSAVEISNH